VSDAPSPALDPVNPARAQRAERVIIAALLITTLSLGVFLRFQLAGVWSDVGDFKQLRHAHSHLGYYGVLFPLLWLGWRASGGRVLSPPGFALYALAAAVSALSFAGWGYSFASIAGSTVVGGGWLVVAWRNRAWLRARSSWRFVGPPAVVIGACFVPPIAVFTSRDPEFAQELVRTFLGVLVFGVFVPGALDRLRVRALYGPVWLVAAAVASVWLGLGVHPLLSAGLLVCGGWIAFAVGRGRMPWWLRAVWLAFGFGAMGLAAGLVPKTIAMTLGALHFAFLGPLLVTWVRDSRGEPPLWLVVTWFTPVLILSASVSFGWPQVAAWSGAAVLTMAVVGAAALALRTREGGE